MKRLRSNAYRVYSTLLLSISCFSYGAISTNVHLTKKEYDAASAEQQSAVHTAMRQAIATAPDLKTLETHIRTWETLKYVSKNGLVKLPDSDTDTVLKLTRNGLQQRDEIQNHPEKAEFLTPHIQGCFTSLQKLERKNPELRANPHLMQDLKSHLTPLPQSEANLSTPPTSQLSTHSWSTIITCTGLGITIVGVIGYGIYQCIKSPQLSHPVSTSDAATHQSNE